MPSTTTSIVCTGIDTLDELREKYRDVDSVLARIRSCGGGGDGDDDDATTAGGGTARARQSFDVAIVHGVNAVRADSSSSADCDGGGGGALDRSTTTAFDHVIFNHPHLGTEDARLHSRFLRHLFHAASERWMAPGSGLLHLTLVRGQCERWGCVEGASWRGLRLLRRGDFRPPPPATARMGTMAARRTTPRGGIRAAGASPIDGA